MDRLLRLDIKFIFVLTNQLKWSTGVLSDFEHWVWNVLHCPFTLLTDVIIFSDGTLEPNSNDWSFFTVVTNDIVMNNLGLSSHLLL